MPAKNPPTKDKLESPHFLSFSPGVQARLTACLRSDPAHIVPFSPPSGAIEAIKQGLNKVQPKNSPMKVVTDPPNEFGQSMADAVLIYKSNNGIIRVGQKLDNIVGRMTLARLDSELANLPEPKPPAPLEFGSTSFRFTLFCNRTGTLTIDNQFELFIASTDGRDSGSFKVDRPFIGGDARMTFRGETRGVFNTRKKVLVERFGKEGLTLINITRFSGQLQGVMDIALIGKVPADRIEIVAALPKFKDETFNITDGNVIIRGDLVRR